MTPEKWQAIERLYLAALERDTAERADFLRSASAGDDELRREVAALLEYQPKVETFLNSAAAIDDGAMPGTSDLDPPPPIGRLTGRLFGSYEVQRLIAAGGMGEVYRAFDTRLRRAVAIKVLPEHLSDQPERRERFKREAMLISSLNHPHICAIYHVGTHDGLDHLVMELIDGETLEHRLKHGRVHWADAVHYLIEIADALDAAHRQGIVHRDLKPANVMLTKSGAKVLDFGLAARRTGPPGFVSAPGSAGGTALTAEGRIMGTVPYMAPEQLQGEPTDARADIFAFGALAYEMVSGKAPFAAGNQAGLIGAILKDNPEPLATAVPRIPPALAQTISRCLAKDPRERWQTAGDLTSQLRSIDESIGVSMSGTSSRSSRRVERGLWFAAVTSLLLFGLWEWVQKGRAPEDDRSSSVAAVTRFSLSPPEGLTFPSSFDVPFALSPDGHSIAYVAAGDDGVRHLWVRALDSEQPQALTGTDDAHSPFWSPDSEWVAFFANGSLKKVRVTSPIAEDIARDAWTIGGAAWNRNDVIVFPGPGGLLRVSANANGGKAAPVGHDSNYHLWPQFLDDGEHYIYSSFTPRRVLLGSLSGEAPRTLMTFPVNVSALAYASGFILYVQDGALLARPFDQRARTFSGQPRRLLDGIPVTGPGRAPFSASETGVLAFSTDPAGTTSVLRWSTRNGADSPAIDAPARYFGFALSPDNRQLAFARVGGHGGPDLWMRTLDTGHETQLTFDGVAFSPRWSTDGSRLLFTGVGERPPPTLFIKDLRHPSSARLLGAAPGPQFASSWSGQNLLSVIAGIGPPQGRDLLVQREGGGPPERLPVDTGANESEGRFSPDGKWIAYTTDESGRDEVWIASFPSAQVRRQVSFAGGISPQWCGSGELVYLAADQHLVAVPFHGSAAHIELGDPRQLFRRTDLVRLERPLAPTMDYYVATADCQRFLLATRPSDWRPTPISVIVNWPTLLPR